MLNAIRAGAAVATVMLFAAACSTEPAPTPKPKEKKDESLDPLTALPNNYKLEFENDYVRIVRVHYDAGSKLPEHTHPAGSTVYVYLNDNEKVIFYHDLSSERSIERPPVKAGGARFATSREEHHMMENPSSTPSDFIRILVKTDQVSLGAVRRRIALSEQQYSNRQVRVTRLDYKPGESLSLPVSAAPSVIVAWPSGAHQFVEAKAAVTIATEQVTPSGLIRVELLTAPLK